MIKLGAFGVYGGSLVLGAAFLILSAWVPFSTTPIEGELRWVNKNHAQILYHRHWEELPLMPLSAEHCARAGLDSQRYCE